MKPKHQGGYNPLHTEYCERTLVTILRGLGPWKTSIYLIGGLVPRYLISNQAGQGADAHIGTTDVDIVLNLDVLADVEAYRKLEKNLEVMKFERGKNDDGREQNHRWMRNVADGVTVVLDLLCDVDEGGGGRPVNLPKTAGRLSALKIPGAHLVFEDFVEVPIRAELLDERGVTTERIRVAGITAFLLLKALAYDDRAEEKDAYDIIYALTNYEGGPESAAKAFSEKMRSSGAAGEADQALFQRAVDCLRNRFVDDEFTPGIRKDGPISYAYFLADPGNPDRDVRNKRDAAAVVKIFLENL